MPPLAVLRAGTLAESDTFWQVRAGELILDRHTIPTTDPFSWTAAGQPWTLNSWGFDALLAVAYRAFGLAAVALAGALFVLAVAAVLLALARRLGATPAITGVVLIVGFALVYGWLSVRPQLVDYVAVPLLVMLLGALVRGGGRRVVVLGAVLALSVLWVNLHATVLLGVLVAAAAAVLGAVSRLPARRVAALVLAAVAVAVGGLVNPKGPGVLSQSADVVRASEGVVIEWGHLDPTAPPQLLGLLFGLVALVVAVRRRYPALAGGLAVCAAGSVYAVRLLPILVVLAVPVIAALASATPVRDYLARRMVVFRPAAIVFVAIVSVMAVGSLGHLGQPAPSIYPTTALLERIPAGCRPFNSYALGGLVVLERPDVLVAVDSRNDVYGRTLVLDIEQAVRRTTGDVEADVRGAGCVLVPRDSGLAQRLRGQPGWTSLGAEPSVELFVRR